MKSILPSVFISHFKTVEYTEVSSNPETRCMLDPTKALTAFVHLILVKDAFERA